MGSKEICFFLGVALCLLPAAVTDTVCVADGVKGVEANLDLPYDAGGTSSQEELAPEVIFFFGQAYEASAVVFALDESGSMKKQGRWQLQSREVIRAIAQLNSHADFGVLYYGNRVTPFSERPVRATVGRKGAAVSFVSSRRPAGNTCLFEGLLRALTIVGRSSNPYRAVILTSDGRPDFCPTGDRATAAQVDLLIGKTLAANPGLKIKVHTVWVGSGSDVGAIAFMKHLGAAHGGTFRQVNR